MSNQIGVVSGQLAQAQNLAVGTDSKVQELTRHLEEHKASTLKAQAHLETYVEGRPDDASALACSPSAAPPFAAASARRVVESSRGLGQRPSFTAEFVPR